jgi:NAD(P)-dependent dehydrogenase (short-subunit alcohol dehydrogenase family)
MTATRLKTWFITGASRGFGCAWTRAALKRGDHVAATARDTGTLIGLAAEFGDAILPITLDVTDRAAGIAAVQRAHAHFGRLDVVVNNAGYGHFGFIEELTEAEVRGQIETNLLGPLWITQAAIPLLRQQGGGHILQISGFAGVIAFPGLGIYNASKWALEGLTESLAQEVAGFGITITLIEPGGFATDWADSAATRPEPDPLYQPFRDAAEQAYGSMRLPVAEDSVTAIFAAVDAGQPPARLLLTRFAADAVPAAYHDRLRTRREWGTYLPLGGPCLT